MSNCWTEEQLKAIESRKNVLVSASAGSGKTSVMIERMAQIILNQEADISQILATTFTTLAASQMKEKLAKRLKEELPNKPELKKQLDELAYANVSTIHSFCGNLIKNYFYRLDIDASYKILEGVNETDLKLVAINNLFSHLYETSNPDFLALVEKYQTNRKDDNLQEAVLSIYKYVISEADPKAFLENALTLYTQDGLNKIENLVLLEQAEDLSLVKSVLLNLRQQGITYERITSHIDTLLEFISEVENKDLLSAYNFCLTYTFIRKLSPSKKDPIYNQIIDNLERCRTLLKDIYGHFLTFYPLIYTEKDSFLATYNDFKKLSDLVLLFKQEYDQLKRESNVLDFNDLEHFTIELLKNDEIAQDVKSKFKFIFVDEYQDVNPAQEYIIKRLENNNLFLVGDIKQSIYNFRGCNSNLFLKTQKEFKESGMGDNLQLTQNFRSASNVIQAVNKVFCDVLTEKDGGFDYKNNPMIYGNGYGDFIGESKAILYSTSKKTREKTTPTSVYDIDDYISLDKEDEKLENEGVVIANLINSLVGNKYYDSKNKTEKPISYGDIVILYRSANSNVKQILKTLRESGIRVCINTKKEKISYPEIAMLTDLLKLIASHGTQNVPLVSGLRWIANLTDEELVEIKKADDSKTLLESVKKYNKQDLIYQKIQNYNQILSSLILKSEIADASEVVADLIAKTNLEARLGAEFYGSDKIKRLYNFMNFAKGYSVEEYVQKLALEEFNFSPTAEAEDSVSMMTIHSSKGLEFPIVILAGCGEGFGKNEFRSSILFDRDFGIDIQYKDTENKISYDLNALSAYIKKKRTKEIIQEELRLLYVALTRAESHLFIVGKSSNLYVENYAFDTKIANSYFSVIKEQDFKTESVSNANVTLVNSGSKEVLVQEKNKDLIPYINKNLSFTYPNLEDIPIKKSVTSINFEEHKIYDITTEFGYTSAEKGSAYHKFLECWDFAEDYLEYYNGKAKLDLLKEEYDLLEQEKLQKICSMEVFNLIKNYEIYKEKDFFVGVPFNLISNSDTTKEVIVQGTIDLLAVSKDKAVIIDYKLSSIAQEQDLIDKYKTQLALYAYAVKKLLKLDVECYLVNILSQKLIKLSKEDITL